MAGRFGSVTKWWSERNVTTVEWCVLSAPSYPCRGYPSCWCWLAQVQLFTSITKLHQKTDLAVCSVTALLRTNPEEVKYCVTYIALCLASPRGCAVFWQLGIMNSTVQIAHVLVRMGLCSFARVGLAGPSSKTKLVQALLQVFATGVIIKGSLFSCSTKRERRCVCLFVFVCFPWYLLKQCRVICKYGKFHSYSVHLKMRSQISTQVHIIAWQSNGVQRIIKEQLTISPESRELITAVNKNVYASL